MKLKSPMTLFALTSEAYTIFDQVLEQFFNGEMGELTARLINKFQKKRINHSPRQIVICFVDFYLRL